MASSDGVFCITKNTFIEMSADHSGTYTRMAHRRAFKTCALDDLGGDSSSRRTSLERMDHSGASDSDLSCAAEDDCGPLNHANRSLYLTQDLREDLLMGPAEVCVQPMWQDATCHSRVQCTSNLDAALTTADASEDSAEPMPVAEESICSQRHARRHQCTTEDLQEDYFSNDACLESATQPREETHPSMHNKSGESQTEEAAASWASSMLYSGTVCSAAALASTQAPWQTLRHSRDRHSWQTLQGHSPTQIPNQMAFTTGVHSGTSGLEISQAWQMYSPMVLHPGIHSARTPCVQGFTPSGLLTPMTSPPSYEFRFPSTVISTATGHCSPLHCHSETIQDVNQAAMPPSGMQSEGTASLLGLMPARTPGAREGSDAADDASLPCNHTASTAVAAVLPLLAPSQPASAFELPATLNPKPSLAMMHSNSQSAPRLRRKAPLWVHIHLHMQAPGFDLVPTLIGRRGCNMRKIAQKTGAKLQVRGRGSGHLEAESKREAPCPLMVAVTADCVDQACFQEAVRMALAEIHIVSQRFQRHCNNNLHQCSGPFFTIGLLPDGANEALADVIDIVPIAPEPAMPQWSNTGLERRTLVSGRAYTPD